MKRTKEWWAALTKEERSELIWLERKNYSGSYGDGGYLPDDCSECCSCGQPQLGSGLCPVCSNRLTYLIEKANGGKNEN